MKRRVLKFEPILKATKMKQENAHRYNHVDSKDFKIRRDKSKLFFYVSIAILKVQDLL